MILFTDLLIKTKDGWTAVWPPISAGGPMN